VIIKLNHIALNIREVNEVTDFYQNILGFHPEYQFELSATLGHTIVGINQSLPAYFSKEELVGAFELFVLPGNMNIGSVHVCIEMSNRDELITRCQNKDYKVNSIQIDNNPNLLFIWNKPGNYREIKEE
jgi:catechol 2,3-dioxygenase-like lactoylglutathione lyase family enzyme